MRHLDVSPVGCLNNPTRAELRLCWARYRYLYRLACHEAFALAEPDLVREAVAEVRFYRAEMREAAELRLAMRSECRMPNAECRTQAMRQAQGAIGGNSSFVIPHSSFPALPPVQEVTNTPSPNPLSSIP